MSKAQMSVEEATNINLEIESQEELTVLRAALKYFALNCGKANKSQSSDAKSQQHFLESKNICDKFLLSLPEKI